MSAPDPRDIEVKFARCSLCGGEIEETARDACFIRVETSTGRYLSDNQ